MYNCLYVLFYRGPLGRLANLAKSETLLKYCINKGLNCYQITSHRCILCAAETLKQETLCKAVSLIYFGTDGCNFGRGHYKKHLCEIICV